MEIKSENGHTILISEEDEWLVSHYKWYVARNANGWLTYAHAAVKMIDDTTQRMPMHRLIMMAPKGMLVDHINHDMLDNRRENLRICTHAENARNRQKSYNGCSSFYKGVCWSHADHKWLTQIMCDGKGIYIGLFENEIDAAKAYNKAAIELFGEFAELNGF